MITGLAVRIKENLNAKDQSGKKLSFGKAHFSGHDKSEGFQV